MVFYGMEIDYYLDDLSLCIRRNMTTVSAQQEGAKAGIRSRSKSNGKKMFALYYGYGAIEVLNALSNEQMRQIEILSACLSDDRNPFDSQLNVTKASFVSAASRYFVLSENNAAHISISYLNGYLQQLLPDVHRAILTAAALGIKKSDNIPDDTPPISELGIRSIQLHTMDLSNMDEYDRYLKERAAIWRASQVFSVGDSHPSEAPTPPPAAELREDPHTDEFAEHFLLTHYGPKKLPLALSEGSEPERVEEREEEIEVREDEREDEAEERGRDDGTVYTLFFLLSDRKEFAGSEVWVRNHRDGEEKDEEETEKEEEARRSGLPGYLVSKYTPEKGSLVLVQSGYLHGHSELTAGRRVMLAVELWPYRDAPRDSTRPRLRDAQPFRSSHDFRLEL